MILKNRSVVVVEQSLCRFFCECFIVAKRYKLCLVLGNILFSLQSFSLRLILLQFGFCFCFLHFFLAHTSFKVFLCLCEFRSGLIKCALCHITRIIGIRHIERFECRNLFLGWHFCVTFDCRCVDVCHKFFSLPF